VQNTERVYIHLRMKIRMKASIAVLSLVCLFGQRWDTTHPFQGKFH
jgi:hypothetical protein